MATVMMEKEMTGYNSTATLYWSMLFTPLFGVILTKCTLLFNRQEERADFIPALAASVLMSVIVGCGLCFSGVNSNPRIDCSSPKTLENSKIAVLGYLFRTRIMMHVDRYEDPTAKFTRSYKKLMDSQCRIIREFSDVHKPELKKYDGRNANEIAAYADYMTRR